MIRKMTVILLCLLMMSTFVMAETTDLTGTWYLSAVEAGGFSVHPADVGVTMYIITLNEDGTGTWTVGSDASKPPVNWVMVGETLRISDPDSVIWDLTPTGDGNLLAKGEQMNMIFGREAPGPAFVPAPASAAANVAEFDGTWNITKVNFSGVIVPFSSMAQYGWNDGTVIVENGSFTMQGSEMLGLAVKDEVGTLKDGKLIFPSLTGDKDRELAMSLLEDGTVSVDYYSVVLYCEKADTAE